MKGGKGEERGRKTRREVDHGNKDKDLNEGERKKGDGGKRNWNGFPIKKESDKKRGGGGKRKGRGEEARHPLGVDSGNSAMNILGRKGKIEGKQTASLGVDGHKTNLIEAESEVNSPQSKRKKGGSDEFRGASRLGGPRMGEQPIVLTNKLSNKGKRGEKDENEVAKMRTKRKGRRKQGSRGGKQKLYQGG